MSPRLPDVKHLVILWFMFAISIQFSTLACILLGMCHTSTCPSNIRVCH